MPNVRAVSEGSRSTLSYTPQTSMDYGTLLCLGELCLVVSISYIWLYLAHIYMIWHFPLSRWALSGCLIVFGILYGMALSSVLVSIVCVYVFSCVRLCFVMFGCSWLCLVLFDKSSKYHFKRLQLPTQWSNNRNLAFFISSWQVVMMMKMMVILII